MKRNSIGFVIIMGTILVAGIFLIQFLFLKNSYDLNETQFHSQVTAALRSVASQINEYNAQQYHHSSRTIDAGQVERISNNYYVVNVNDVIDPNLLEHFLETEFKRRNLNMSYEYAIYDCETQKMVFGNSIKRNSMSPASKIVKSNDSLQCSQEQLMFERHYRKEKAKIEKKYTTCDLPTCEKYTYYFGVHFPDRSEFYSSRLLTWYVLNGILFFVVIFFGYAVYIIIKQKQLSEIQKNFINNLTHEFKTPIASIDLAAKVLSNPQICNQPDRLTEYVKIVAQQNKRLYAHVEKLLQMATIEKTKLKLHLEEIELNTFLAETLNEFKNSQNGRNYTVKIASSVENGYIKADKLHFSNLVFNILDNAIKYCHTVPEIIIELNQNKNHYLISFEDNGIGIPSKERKKIFNRFYRISTGNIHDVKGFGLGLDYVRKIASRHNWNIQVIENSKKGSTFIIETKKLLTK
jgi:two-component system, OmpR family, phosphate regulon sensor histidine kinase PhoR